MNAINNLKSYDEEFLIALHSAIKEAICQSGLKGEDATIAEYNTLIKLGLIEKHSTDKHKNHIYLVATCCGGIMESPEIYYENYQIIEADSKEEARQIYNEINKCTYYYGEVRRVLK